MRWNPPTGMPPGRPKAVAGVSIDSIDPTREIPELPENIGPDGEVAWNKIWGAGTHLDYEADFLIVQELCYLIDETNHMRRALALGAKMGGVDRTYQQGKNGSIVIHPYVNQIKDNRAMIMSWLGGLGFGALDRKSLTGEALDAVSKFNALAAEVAESLKNVEGQ